MSKHDGLFTEKLEMTECICERCGQLGIEEKGACEVCGAVYDYVLYHVDGIPKMKVI